MLDALATSWLSLLACAALGYLLGSIPTGLILTRLTGAGDIRRIGSGNIGMTNVLRTGRKDLAALTLLGDAGKGWLAVRLAPLVLSLLGGVGAADDTVFLAGAFAGAGAFLGHCYPVWLGFKGGKGVATYLGVLAAFSWWGVLVFAVVWIGLAYAMRYSSLASMSAALAVPVVLFLLGQVAAAGLFALLAILLCGLHHENIGRLARGEENRFGSR